MKIGISGSQSQSLGSVCCSESRSTRGASAMPMFSDLRGRGSVLTSAPIAPSFSDSSRLHGRFNSVRPRLHAVAVPRETGRRLDLRDASCVLRRHGVSDVWTSNTSSASKPPIPTHAGSPLSFSREKRSR